MDSDRERAYRLVSSLGLLHLKWDLACLDGGFFRSPGRFWCQRRSVRRAAGRAFAFHNLAIFATQGFRGFSEERFWGDVDRFLRDFPEAGWCNYRGIFEASLRGEPMNVIRSGGGVAGIAHQ